MLTATIVTTLRDVRTGDDCAVLLAVVMLVLCSRSQENLSCGGPVRW